MDGTSSESGDRPESEPVAAGAAAGGADAPHASARAHFERKRPGWFTAHVFNPFVALLTRMGISLYGSRVLEVRGRTSGQPRRTPVNLLTFGGQRYLVAPRGNTQWARNLRACGEGRLLVGPRSESFNAVELSDEEKPEVLRAYLKRWKWEVGTFFDGVGPDSTEAQLREAAPRHPVFRVERAQ